VRVWLPPTFEGVDPEQRISRRYKNQALNDRQSTINN
jgi:hypothetical protein